LQFARPGRVLTDHLVSWADAEKMPRADASAEKWQFPGRADSVKMPLVDCESSAAASLRSLLLLLDAGNCWCEKRRALVEDLYSTRSPPTAPR